MTTSIFKNRMIAEGRRLHRSIMSWAAKHGLWAYRVLTPTDAWFELYDPKTRKVSLKFPARIEEAIGRCQAELAAYDEWSRSSYPPPVAGPSQTLGRTTPIERGGDACDCNAATRSAVSGKTAEIGPAAVSGRKNAVISASIALAAALACNFAPCGEIRTSPAVIAGGVVDFEENFLTNFFFGGGARVSYTAGESGKKTEVNKMAKSQKLMTVARLAHASWNPRTPEELDWGHPEMVPLIASVKAVGIIQPIAVWADPQAIEDVGADSDELDGIVIAGNRRLEAAKAAGLREIPALVFTDISIAQAQEITRLENEVRLGVDPMKDASLIGSMLGLGYSQKEIAAHFGVSEARICRRRKLLDLCPELRERAEAADGNITIDALERISVYPREIQKACARDITARAKGTSHALKWTDISWLVSQRTRDLALARFDVGECRSCPNRTGAMPDLFGEADPNALGRCLGVDCFRRKMHAAAAEKLRKKHPGVELIDGVEAGIKTHYDALNDDAVFGPKKSKTRPALWYWIDTCSNCDALFGPTVDSWKKLKKKRAEEHKKAMDEAKKSEAARHAADAAQKALLAERDSLCKQCDKSVDDVVSKVIAAVDYSDWQKDKNAAGKKMLDDALKSAVKSAAPRAAIVSLLITAFDDGYGREGEIVEFCNAFPAFAKACKITGKDLEAIVQARTQLDTFYAANPDLAPSSWRDSQ